MTASIFERTFTRRRALSGGVACAVTALAYRGVCGALVSEGSRATTTRDSLIFPALYAFAGEAAATTAIAVAWQERLEQAKVDSNSHAEIYIHAGSKTWVFDIRDQALGKVQRSDDMSVFIGDVLAFSGGVERPVRAVVIELPNRAMGQSGTAGIWGEYNAAGLRQRIGTPFLANLVAADRNLAVIYHASSPAEDRERITDPLARSIAARLRANGFSSDPGPHSRRLASALLPDVLRYDSCRPTGFTFAAQNGRHPSERTDEVVNGLLKDSASSASFLPSAFQYVASFPYFRQAQQSI